MFWPYPCLIEFHHLGPYVTLVKRKLWFKGEYIDFTQRSGTSGLWPSHQLPQRLLGFGNDGALSFCSGQMYTAPQYQLCGRISPRTGTPQRLVSLNISLALLTTWSTAHRHSHSPAIAGFGDFRRAAFRVLPNNSVRSLIFR